MNDVGQFLDFLSDHFGGIAIIGGGIFLAFFGNALNSIVAIVESHMAEESADEDDEEEYEEEEEEDVEPEPAYELTEVTLVETLETLYVSGRESLGRAYMLGAGTRWHETYPRRNRFIRR